MSSEIKVDTISEKTSANGVTIDGLTIKDGNILGDVALAGTTPTFTIGDAGAEDAALIFDGNQVDFVMGVDDSADEFRLGIGTTLGSTRVLEINSSGDTVFQKAVQFAGSTPTVTVGDGGAEDTKIVFDGNAVDYYIALDDSADNLIIGSGSTVGSNSLITIDSDGDFTLDSTGDIILDVGGGDIKLTNAGSNVGEINLNSNGGDIQLANKTQDKDITFHCNDGGGIITVLTLDGSDAGKATFNNHVVVSDRVIGSADLILTSSDANEKIHMDDAGFIKFESDGVEAMRIDSSQQVGIGTSSPANTLHVDASGGGTIKLTRLGNSTDAFLRLACNGTDGTIVSHAGINLDAGGDILLDSDAANWRFQDAGTSILEIGAGGTGGGPSLYSAISDADMVFKGNDGGSAITALTLDMSDAGTATFNHDVKLGDNSKAIFGAGSDLEIIHNSSSGNSFISDVGTGSLIISSNQVTFQNAAKSETLAQLTEDGTVSLRYDNTEKLLTSSTGINLPQDGDGIKFGANSEIELTHVHDSGLKISHDGGGDPDLILANTASASDGNQLGSIFFNGQDAGGSEHTYAFMLAQARDVTAGEEDGQLIIYANKGGSDKQMISIGANANGASPQHEVCMNDSGEDVDFRVESEGGTHAFFVNAASNNGCAGFYSASDSAQLFIENQNAAGGRNALFINNPSSTDTATGVNARTTRSSSLSSNVYFLGASNSGSDAEFRVRGDGEVSADGSFTGGGADYAEYFEWKDGNASDEDRVGYSVVLDGNKIVKATNSDDVSKIIGVISADPAVVGDGDIDRWKQKFLLDDFGREITEEITVTEWRGEHTTDEGIFNKNYLYSYDTDRIPSDVTVPSDAEVKSVDDNGNKFLRRKTNPDWNESETYISREDRKEWDTVGLMGKLRLKKGQPTGTNWIKMRDISDNVEEWLVR